MKRGLWKFPIVIYDFLSFWNSRRPSWLVVTRVQLILSEWAEKVFLNASLYSMDHYCQIWVQWPGCYVIAGWSFSDRKEINERMIEEYVQFCLHKQTQSHDDAKVLFPITEDVFVDVMKMDTHSLSFVLHPCASSSLPQTCAFPAPNPCYLPTHFSMGILILMPWTPYQKKKKPLKIANCCDAILISTLDRTAHDIETDLATPLLVLFCLHVRVWEQLLSGHLWVKRGKKKKKNSEARKSPVARSAKVTVHRHFRVSQFIKIIWMKILVIISSGRVLHSCVFCFLSWSCNVHISYCVLHNHSFTRIFSWVTI